MTISFGEYKPEPNDAAWGLDMFAVGPHDTERTVQPTGDGTWAKPAWVASADTPDALITDRALLMDGPSSQERPLLPGASVRGPLRHAFSRRERMAGHDVQDPHLVQGDVGEDDIAGQAFGTVSRSSRILIRDAHAEGEWSAAKLHMHAEDEFSAGSYGTAKRDAVRVLQGVFPVRIVIEGATPEEVEPLVKLINRQIALGALGHLPVGGHKTRGAGAGRWTAKSWVSDDVKKVRDWTPPKEPDERTEIRSHITSDFIKRPDDAEAWIKATNGSTEGVLTLGEATALAKAALGEKLVAWWCDPTIDLNLHTPPATYGNIWPSEDETLQVDEVAFYAERAVWRAIRTSDGASFVFIQEVPSEEDGAKQTRVVHTPARLYAFKKRFSSAETAQGNVLLREWYDSDEILGFTITQEQR